MRDDLGDRMKGYESAECGRRFMPLLPILARVDGRAFHSFTRGLRRPYDPAMQACMVATAVALAEETNACMVYTQSDEISLAWHASDSETEVWFNGRITKMTSQLAALATLHFYRAILEHLPAYADKLPSFDARVWQVPTRIEGANAFLWREWDAIKNSITMAASALYSPKQLHGKNGAEKLEMLKAKGVDWNAYPESFKRGTYVQRRVVERPFTMEEISKLPPKHHARRNPDLRVRRTTVGVVPMPPLVQVANRVGVIFDGELPVRSEPGAHAAA
jgi:tRNA(His) 5'-end guanylyltransferase